MLRIGLFDCLKNSLIIYDFWIGVLRGDFSISHKIPSIISDFEVVGFLIFSEYSEFSEFSEFSELSLNSLISLNSLLPKLPTIKNPMANGQQKIQ